MVNPNADGRGGTGDAAKEPGRCCGLHPPARSHDGYWVQQPPQINGLQGQPSIDSFNQNQAIIGLIQVSAAARGTHNKNSEASCGSRSKIKKSTEVRCQAPKNIRSYQSDYYSGIGAE